MPSSDGVADSDPGNDRGEQAAAPLARRRAGRDRRNETDAPGGPAGGQTVNSMTATFELDRFAWEDGAVEFHLPHGEMFRLLRDSGFEVEDLVEVEITEDATTRYPFVSPEWARRWPAEEVWKARKR